MKFLQAPEKLLYVTSAIFGMNTSITLVQYFVQHVSTLSGHLQADNPKCSKP
jgi:hypothetical protein